MSKETRLFREIYKDKLEKSEKIKHQNVIRDIIPEAKNVSYNRMFETVSFSTSAGLHWLELKFLRSRGYDIYFISVDSDGLLEITLSTLKVVE